MPKRSSAKRATGRTGPTQRPKASPPPRAHSETPRSAAARPSQQPEVDTSHDRAAEGEFHVRSDRPIRSIKLAGQKVPPWFRLFKAIVLNGLVREMTLADCRVLLCLGAFQSERNPWTVYPAIRTIADMTGLKERAVYNAIKRLEQLKVIRRESGGGRSANRYTLMPLAVDRRRGQRPDESVAHELLEEIELEGPENQRDLADNAPVHHDAPLHDNARVHAKAPLPRGADLPGRAPVLSDTPQPRAPEASSGAPARSRYRSNEVEPISRTEPAAAESEEEGRKLATRALIERGVGEPTLSRLLDSTEPATVLRHVLDFDLRNQLAREKRGGQEKATGWLVKSILVGYDLHERTLAELEARQQAERAAQRRAAEQAEAQQREEREAQIDAWAEEQVDEADDEELAAWKRRALEQYPQLTRGLTKADPRDNPRLRRLIKGMLAALYDDLADA